MPPVLGPVSSSPTRLKSCAGMSGTTRVPSQSTRSEHSSTLEPLLDHHGAPGIAEGGARELGRHVLAGLVEGVGHPHALAGGQTRRS